LFIAKKPPKGGFFYLCKHWPSVISNQVSAFSYQHSVISIQLSAFSYQYSVVSIQLSVFSYQLSAFSYQHSVFCLTIHHSPFTITDLRTLAVGTAGQTAAG
jgi:hypothetical protein